MKTDIFISQVGEWLKAAGPDNDIVISSRIRLARNLRGYPFTSIGSPEKLAEVEALISAKLEENKIIPDMTYLKLKDLTQLERTLLVERHLISKDHAEKNGSRALAVDKNESLSIMVNEEDHMRLQILKSGLQLTESWKEIDELDNRLEKELPYAFSPQFGYLTACPTNVGTGMRTSVMLHLPALGMTHHIEKVFNAVMKLGLVVRVLYGEGTQVSGDLYQISNQFTLGKSEIEIIEIIESVIPRIASYERMARKALVSESRSQLEDRVWRSYGMLKVARLISSEEIMHLLSQVRMGVNLGIINDIEMKTLNELFILTLPGHLQKLEGRELNSTQRNIIRASYVRKRLER